MVSPKMVPYNYKLNKTTCLVSVHSFVIFLISVKKAWHRTARRGFKNVCLTSKAILSSMFVFICHLQVNKQWERAIIYSEGLSCKTSSSCFIFKGMLLWFLRAVRFVSAMTDGSVQDYKTNFTTIQILQQTCSWKYSFLFFFFALNYSWMVLMIYSCLLCPFFLLILWS